MGRIYPSTALEGLMITWERLLETINRLRRSSEILGRPQGSEPALKCLEGTATGPSIQPSVINI